MQVIVRLTERILSLNLLVRFRNDAILLFYATQRHLLTLAAARNVKKACFGQKALVAKIQTFHFGAMFKSYKSLMKGGAA